VLTISSDGGASCTALRLTVDYLGCSNKQPAGMRAGKPLYSGS
jgi:hypothetical protein